MGNPVNLFFDNLSYGLFKDLGIVEHGGVAGIFDQEFFFCWGSEALQVFLCLAGRGGHITVAGDEVDGHLVVMAVVVEGEIAHRNQQRSVELIALDQSENIRWLENRAFERGFNDVPGFAIRKVFLLQGADLGHFAEHDLIKGTLWVWADMAKLLDVTTVARADHRAFKRVVTSLFVFDHVHQLAHADIGRHIFRVLQSVERAEHCSPGMPEDKELVFLITRLQHFNGFVQIAHEVLKIRSRAGIAHEGFSGSALVVVDHGAQVREISSIT